MYNHETGLLDRTVIIDVNSYNEFLILEGMYTLKPDFENVCDYSIMLSGDFNKMYLNFCKRDKKKRNIPDKELIARFLTFNGQEYNLFLSNNRQNAQLNISIVGSQLDSNDLLMLESEIQLVQ